MFLNIRVSYGEEGRFRKKEAVVIGLVALFSVLDESDGGNWLSFRFSAGVAVPALSGDFACTSGTCGLLDASSSGLHLISSRSWTCVLGFSVAIDASCAVSDSLYVGFGANKFMLSQ